MSKDYSGSYGGGARGGASSSDYVKPTNETKPDYKKWKIYEFWKLSEGAYLLSGMEPAEAHHLPKEVMDIYNLGDRAIEAGILASKTIQTGYGPEAWVKPTDFVLYAKSKGLDIPEELVDLLKPQKTDLIESPETNPAEIGKSSHIEKAVMAGIIAAEYLRDNQSRIKKVDLANHNRIGMSPDSKNFRAIWNALPEKYARHSQGRPTNTKS